MRCNTGFQGIFVADQKVGSSKPVAGIVSGVINEKQSASA